MGTYYSTNGSKIASGVPVGMADELKKLANDPLTVASASLSRETQVSGLEPIPFDVFNITAPDVVRVGNLGALEASQSLRVHLFILPTNPDDAWVVQVNGVHVEEIGSPVLTPDGSYAKASFIVPLSTDDEQKSRIAVASAVFMPQTVQHVALVLTKVVPTMLAKSSTASSS